MSLPDHPGHDHGGNESPWLTRFSIGLVIFLIGAIVFEVLAHHLGYLP